MIPALHLLATVLAVQAARGIVGLLLQGHSRLVLSLLPTRPMGLVSGSFVHAHSHSVPRFLNFDRVGVSFLDGPPSEKGLSRNKQLGEDA